MKNQARSYVVIHWGIVSRQDRTRAKRLPHGTRRLHSWDWRLGYDEEWWTSRVRGVTWSFLFVFRGAFWYLT